MKKFTVFGGGRKEISLVWNLPDINTKIASVILSILLSLSAIAQTSPVAEPDDIQSWNDVQLTIPLLKEVDFVSTVTMRIGKHISRLNDGRFAVGIVYKPNKFWSFQPFYWYLNARNSRGQFHVEHRLNFRIGYKVSFKNFVLTHRSWFEYRLREPQNSWRYRPSLTFEKNLPQSFIPQAKFFLTEEVFYDSILNKFSRHRLTVGINKILTKKLSVDGYFMRQNDGYSRPGDLTVIGTSWRIKL